ncbi:hypothetical protein F5I97DRAFT_1902602 [Phlebopus sp. FC_14]|nr:hypothetical protein F5I97DRAFT_1902602 [Phlebopus sp. FC_14]
MGLAGRKQKQRIPADPRNLSWADDAARFGQSYLSKFGWDSSKGLGTSGNGTKSHIKVSQKLDMLGIGAAHQRDPHGVAWKQNRDFEALLKRLNGNSEGDKPHDTMEGNFIPAAAEKDDTSADDNYRVERTLSQAEKKHRKRKRDSTEEEEEKEKESNRKRKKDKRKKSKALEEVKVAEVVQDEGVNISLASIAEREPQALASGPVDPALQLKIKGRPMAHRARIQAAKRLVNKSAAAISEILGIVPTSSPSTSSSAMHSGSVTPADSELHIETITTSAKSVGDYFKEKLGSKSSGTSTPAQDANGFARSGGLSSRSAAFSMFSEDADRPRAGLGKMSNLSISSLFATSTLQSVTQLPATADTVVPAGCVSEPEQKPGLQRTSSEDSTERQRKKARRKEEKRKKVGVTTVGEREDGVGSKEPESGNETKAEDSDIGKAKAEKRKKHRKSASEVPVPKSDHVCTESSPDKKSRKERQERHRKARSPRAN